MRFPLRFAPAFRFALLCFIATSAASRAVSAPADQPNILLIIADQWRAQAFGFAGDPNVKTPHFDRFERESVNFTQAVSGQPVCTPARASLLTGQRPLTHGLFINDVPLKAEAITIAEVLSNAGYATGCIGKWHVDGQVARTSSRASAVRVSITGRCSSARMPTTTRRIMPTVRRN